MKQYTREELIAYWREKGFNDLADFIYHKAKLEACYELVNAKRIASKRRIRRRVLIAIYYILCLTIGLVVGFLVR